MPKLEGSSTPDQVRLEQEFVRLLEVANSILGEVRKPVTAGAYTLRRDGASKYSLNSRQSIPPTKFREAVMSVESQLTEFGVDEKKEFYLHTNVSTFGFDQSDMGVMVPGNLGRPFSGGRRDNLDAINVERVLKILSEFPVREVREHAQKVLEQ
jgi:hypothetical protein